MGLFSIKVTDFKIEFKYGSGNDSTSSTISFQFKDDPVKRKKLNSRYNELIRKYKKKDAIMDQSTSARVKMEIIVKERSIFGKASTLSRSMQGDLLHLSRRKFDQFRDEFDKSISAIVNISINKSSSHQTMKL